MKEIRAWWINVAWPWLRVNVIPILSRWWADLETNGELHFVTAVMALCMLALMKIGAKLIAQ